MNSQLLQTSLIAVMEKLLNQALALDPATRSRVTALSGHCIKVTCTAPSFSLLVVVGDGDVMLQSTATATDQQISCEISGNSMTLLRLIGATHKANTLPDSGVTLFGDTEVAQTLYKAVADLDIDWEEKLSHWVGDSAAHQIGNQTRQLLHWGRQTADSFWQNIEEYLQEEARTVPPRLEVMAFYSDIEQLTLATDRLAARLQSVADRLHNAQSQPQEPPP